MAREGNKISGLEHTIPYVALEWGYRSTGNRTETAAFNFAVIFAVEVVVDGAGSATEDDVPLDGSLASVFGSHISRI